MWCSSHLSCVTSLSMLLASLHGCVMDTSQAHPLCQALARPRCRAEGPLHLPSRLLNSNAGGRQGREGTLESPVASVHGFFSCVSTPSTPILIFAPLNIKDRQLTGCFWEQAEEWTCRSRDRLDFPKRPKSTRGFDAGHLTADIPFIPMLHVRCPGSTWVPLLLSVCAPALDNISSLQRNAVFFWSLTRLGTPPMVCVASGCRKLEYDLFAHVHEPFSLIPEWSSEKVPGMGGTVSRVVSGVCRGWQEPLCPHAGWAPWLMMWSGWLVMVRWLLCKASLRFSRALSLETMLY